MNIDVKAALGKTTALAVTNGRGGVLLPAGFELTDTIIIALTKQGIHTVEVLDSADNAILTLIKEKKIKHIERLLNEFTTPNMTELRQCLIIQIQS